MQQRETWLLKSWFCKWKCSATGDLWNLRFVQSERWPFMRSLRARFVSPKLLSQTQIAKSSSGASVKLKRQTNCKSANVIYLITCTQCGKQYVGETKRALNERMNGHRSDWTKRRFQRSPVAEHFHLQNHDFNSHVSLSIHSSCQSRIFLSFPLSSYLKLSEIC